MHSRQFSGLRIGAQFGHETLLEACSANGDSISPPDVFGIFFSDFLERNGFPDHSVVVEMLEDSTHVESNLSAAAGYYRDPGFLVAIDDFGSGYSNFERIWGIAPDIVKLDCSILTPGRQPGR